MLSRRQGGWWDSARIGMGPPPLETEHGWLVVYHGVRQTVAGGLYRAGLALLDLDQPAVVLRRSEEWVLGPGADYEVSGDVPNVVFPCGLVHHRESDKLFLYYGAADTRIGLATASLRGRARVPARLPVRLSPPGHSGTPRVLAPSPCAQQHHAVPLELQQPVPRQPAAEQDLGPTSSAWTPPRRTAPRSPAARAATAAWPPAIGYP